MAKGGTALKRTSTVLVAQNGDRVSACLRPNGRRWYLADDDGLYNTVTIDAVGRRPSPGPSPTSPSARPTARPASTARPPSTRSTCARARSPTPERPGLSSVSRNGHAHQARSRRAAPALPDSAGRLPVPRRARPRDLRRQGEVDPQARRLALLQPERGYGATPICRRDRPHRDLVVDDRGRGAAHRAELHQAVQAALQHPAARRQVLPVHRDLARRGLPARLLHARAPPPRPRLLRPVLATPSACAARSTCSARSSCSAPARAPEPGRRSGSPCLDYYIKRCGAPCVGYVSKEEYREGIDGVIAFLSGRFKQIERDLEHRMYFAAGEQDYEQATIERNRLQAVRALLERQRVADESRRHATTPSRSRSRAPRPTRRSSRSATACSRDRQSFYLDNEAEPRLGERRRGVHAPVLRERACRSRR